jgi:hypothetical protein
MDTLGLISYYLNNIAIAIGIISICYVLWIRNKDYGENLTMEENPITITIDNYCGQKITFTASKDARVETLVSIDGAKVVGFDIDVRDDDILIEKEDI